MPVSAPIPPDPGTDATDTLPFIARWRHAGGSERANDPLFISELCAQLGLPALRWWKRCSKGWWR
jgi:hypothetical protein